MTTAEKLTAVAENQQAVFDAGKSAQSRDWWEKYQTYGGKDRTDYIYAFAIKLTLLHILLFTR